MTKPQLHTFAETDFYFEYYKPQEVDAEIEQLRGNLSLAEEGLANAMQEIERLRGNEKVYDSMIEAGNRENERLRGRVEALAFLQYGPDPNRPAAEPGAGLHALTLEEWNVLINFHWKRGTNADCERAEALTAKREALKSGDSHG